jgi:hypothetical protein
MEKTMSVGGVSSYTPVPSTYQAPSSNAVANITALAVAEEPTASAAAVEAMEQNSAALSANLVDISA